MKSFYIEQSNAYLRYHDITGPGRPCIFIHGLGCAASCDYPQVVSDPAFHGRRMLLVDLLGSGFSDRPVEFSYTMQDQAQTIIALIRHLEFESVDIFGHSMGGAIAIEVAHALGDDVQHLVLGEPNLDAGGGFFSRKMAAMPQADFVAFGHGELVDASRAEGSGIWAISLQTSAAYAVHRGAVSLIEGGSPDWRDQLYAFRGAKTVLFGANSLPDDDTEKLAAHGVRVGIVPDAGHSMAWENPVGLARAIRDAIL
ncbi:alpha/beta fold hydrolase [Profundibacter sp.]